MKLSTSDSIIAEVADQVTSDTHVRPAVKTFFDEQTFTASHIVWDPVTKKTVVIDSVLDFDPASGRTATTNADKIVEFVCVNELTVQWHLETHAHADHISAAPYLQRKLGGQVGIGSKIQIVQRLFGGIYNLGDDFAQDGSQFDILFEDGDRFDLGSITVTVLHVPGHTPADYAYVIGDCAFVGDTLFMPDYGTARADFPGGDAATLYQSMRRLLSLPGQTRLFLCHDYKSVGREEYVWETTVAAQRAGNVHIRDGVSQDEFVAMRKKRDAELSMPALLLPAIQVNINAGLLPAAEDNGVHYLKTPLNLL